MARCGMARISASKTTSTLHGQRYHAASTKVSVHYKFDGRQGVNVKVFATQLALHILANANLFPNDHSKPVFTFFYLTGVASSWAQAIND